MKTRIIHTKIYDDGWFNTLSIEYKLLFIYFFTNSRIGQTGIYQLTDRIIQFETGATKEQIRGAKTLFEKAGKVRFYKDWVAVTKSAYYGGYTGKLNDIAYQREYKALPQDVRNNFVNTLSIGYIYTSDTTINHKSEIINHKLKTINHKSEISNEDKEILNTKEDNYWSEKLRRIQALSKKPMAVFVFFIVILLYPRLIEAKTRYVITIKEASSVKADTQARQPVRGIRSTAGSSKSSIVSQIPNEEERAFVATLPHAEQVANIYKHESNFGKNDVCRKKGMANGFGYGETGNGPNCYPTFETVAIQVNQWIELKKHLGSDIMRCLYITGLNSPNCKTNYRFL